MKTFNEWINSLINRREQKETIVRGPIALKMDDTLFWDCHRSLFVSKWMKYDWYALPVTEFLQKYIEEMEETNNTEREFAIQSVILPLFKEVCGFNYDTNIFTAFGVVGAKKANG